MRIRVEYIGDTIDEYPTEETNRQFLLDHFWGNPNVKSVTFIRGSDTSTIYTINTKEAEEE